MWGLVLQSHSQQPSWPNEPLAAPKVHWWGVDESLSSAGRWLENRYTFLIVLRLSSGAVDAANHRSVTPGSKTNLCSYVINSGARLRLCTWVFELCADLQKADKEQEYYNMVLEICFIETGRHQLSLCKIDLPNWLRADRRQKKFQKKVQRVGCDWHPGTSCRRSEVFSHLLCYKNRLKGREKMMRGADDTEESVCGSVTCHGISVPPVKIVHESRGRDEKKEEEEKKRTRFKLTNAAVHGLWIEFPCTATLTKPSLAVAYLICRAGEPPGELSMLQHDIEEIGLKSTGNAAGTECLKAQLSMLDFNIKLNKTKLQMMNWVILNNRVCK